MRIANGRQWFRGQLHTHTYWSDGRGFPEQAVDAYRQRGYDFLCLTDHNRFGEDGATWREVAPDEGPWPPQVSRAMFEAYIQDYGPDWVEYRTCEKITSVRLKTFEEVNARCTEPGRFMLLPGAEITQMLQERHLHINYVNLPRLLPSLQGARLIQHITEPCSMRELIQRNVREIEEAAAPYAAPYLIMLNHPFWAFYDILPQQLIDCAEIRFFEVARGSALHAPLTEAQAYTLEKFWDVVNAFRRLQGQPFLYAVGSDDAHFYDAQRITGDAGVGDALIMVHAAALTPEHVLTAMHRGDYYVSSGVFLDDISFTSADNTLRVAVQAEAGVQYRIHFITTRRGFDQRVTEIASPAADGRPARTVPLYADDIGRVVQTVVGTEAAYRIAADDLYVRARIESDRPSPVPAHFHPVVTTAWTQPYSPGDDMPAP